jgi:Na+/proline symporter
MKGFSGIDLAAIIVYFAFTVWLGIAVKRRATKDTESFFLGGRSIPWWMLGLSGCSSYIDISGTIAVVTAIFYVGAKSNWIFHAIWGLFTMAVFMAYQAKYVRRSGVRTFAEWNLTRFGPGRSTELARLASAVFVVVLMIFNFAYLAVGVGKFASEFLPFAPWQFALVTFAVVGVYCSFGGFMGVILTDVFQTVLIGIGAFVLAGMAWQLDPTPILAGHNPGWLSVAPSLHLWPGYIESSSKTFAHYNDFGILLAASLPWLLFRLLSGPNVWDFQFFLSLRSARDASLAAGLWTVGNLLRWIIAIALVIIGVSSFGVLNKDFDGESLLPLVLGKLPIGFRGLFVAVMLAALMSSISAMANLTGSVITNDFVRRMMAGRFTERKLVRIGQIVSWIAILLGFLMSLAFTSVVAIWEIVLYVVVTTILVPATMRWHWWRFGPLAFVWSMVATAAVCIVQKVAAPDMSMSASLAVIMPASLALTVLCGYVFPAADRETLVGFYARVRPFGVWGPIRRVAVERGLVSAHDPLPKLDAANAVLCCAFQFASTMIPFYLLLKQTRETILWIAVTGALVVILYFTWYKTLPSGEEHSADTTDC